MNRGRESGLEPKRNEGEEDELLCFLSCVYISDDERGGRRPFPTRRQDGSGVDDVGQCSADLRPSLL